MRRSLLLLGLVLCAGLPSPAMAAGDPPAAVAQPDTRAEPAPEAAEESEVKPSAKAFRSFDNFDIDGGDFRTLRDIDSGECIAACRADERCRAFTFNKWNRRCFLKDRLSELRLEPSSITGLRGDVPAPPRLKSEITMTVYRNRLFPGAAYAVRRTESYAACEALCAEDRVCAVFSFIKASRECRLLARARDYVPDERADSGTKRQVLR